MNRCGRQVDVMLIPHESARLRDIGPTFLVDGKGGSAATDWQFNGWGEQVNRWSDDAALAHCLLGEAEVRRFRAPLTLEGTAFCSDGEGTLIASSSAILDIARNTGASKLGAFDILSRWLGVKRVIWIDPSLGKDPGNGEIRRSCAFAAPGRALVGQQAGSPLGVTLDEIAGRLANAEDVHGRRMKVDRVPILEISGRIASYTTFYVLNKAVLIPHYGTTEDTEVAGLFKILFPGRTIVGIDATAIIAGGASLSRLLQYQPARLLERGKATLLPKSAWHRPVPDYLGLLETYIERVEKEK